MKDTERQLVLKLETEKNQGRNREIVRSITSEIEKKSDEET